MDEILKSIRATLYDRAVSPLSGGFVIAWLLWNFKIVAIFLSGESISIQFDALDNLDKDYSPSIFGIPVPINYLWGNGLLFPLITALLYIYVYPLVAAPIYKYSLNKQRDLRDLKNKANRERLLTKEESAKILSDLAEIRIKYEEDIDGLEKTNEALVEERKRVEGELTIKINELKELTEDFDRERKDLEERAKSNAASEEQNADLIQSLEKKVYELSTREFSLREQLSRKRSNDNSLEQDSLDLKDGTLRDVQSLDTGDELQNEKNEEDYDDYMGSDWGSNEFDPEYEEEQRLTRLLTGGDSKGS